MCRRDLFKSAETFSEAALTRIAADLLLFQRRLVAGMLRLVTRSLRADLFRFYVANNTKAPRRYGSFVYLLSPLVHFKSLD